MTAYTTWADRAGPSTTIPIYAVYAGAGGRYVLPAVKAGDLGGLQAALSAGYDEAVQLRVILDGAMTAHAVEIAAGEVAAGPTDGAALSVEDGAVVQVEIVTTAATLTTVELHGQLVLQPDDGPPMRYLLRPWRIRPVVASIEVDPAAVEVVVGAALQLTATARDAAGGPVSAVVAWSSTASGVAAVDDSGLVTGIAEGAASVRATATPSGVVGTAAITVLPAPVVASVELSPDPAAVQVGEMLQLTATALDAEGEPVDVMVEWSSTQAAVATVDSSGLVTGVTDGAATIRATAPNGVYGELEVTVTAPALYVDLMDEGISVAGIYTRFADYLLNAPPAGWTPDVNSTTRWKVITDGIATFLRMKHPTGLGGSFVTTLDWTDAGAITGDVELLMTVRSAQDNESMRGKIWRDAASINVSVAGQLRMTGDRLSILRNGGIQSETAANSFPMTTGVKYKLRTRLVGTTMYLRAWEDGTTEPGAWALTFTIPGVSTSVGMLALEVSVVNGSNSAVDIFDFAYAIGGGTAPSDYPVAGWVVPPTGYSIRLSSIPAGVRVTADGVESAVTGGVAIVSRASVPSAIEILDAGGALLKSVAAPANHRSYSVEMYYG